MKKSEILKKVKCRIAKGDDFYICVAVNVVTPDEALARELKAWIASLLGYAVSYREWLFRNHPEFFSKHVTEDMRCREGRLQWLDWMIQYWEAREAADAQCTLCAKVESPGFYTGCMINDGACTNSGYTCDGNGNLKREVNMQNIPIGTEEGNRIREAVERGAQQIDIVEGWLERAREECEL